MALKFISADDVPVPTIVPVRLAVPKDPAPLLGTVCVIVRTKRIPASVDGEAEQPTFTQAETSVPKSVNVGATRPFNVEL